MGESTGVIPSIDATDTEIELSAQDLLALSDLGHVDEHATSSVPQPSKPARSAPPNKLSLPLSLVAAAVVAGVAYVVTSLGGASQSAVDTSQQIAQSEQSAQQQFAESKPVRFANPFDADEVFEFPAGTSEAEARDAVADVLLKRAISRQET